MSRVLQIYTDGGFWTHSEEGNGAWAFVVVENKEVVFTKVGMVTGTTNNQMELQGIIEALVWLEEPCREVLIFSDSKYCVAGITTWVHGWAEKGWKTADKGEVKNQMQWKTLHSLVYQGVQRNLDFKWVKGHSGNKYNDMADELCTAALQTFNTLNRKTARYKAMNFQLPDYTHLIKEPPPIQMMKWGTKNT